VERVGIMNTDADDFRRGSRDGVKTNARGTEQMLALGFTHGTDGWMPPPDASEAA
jgi:hypothetical protein